VIWVRGRRFQRQQLVSEIGIALVMAAIGAVLLSWQAGSNQHTLFGEIEPQPA